MAIETLAARRYTAQQLIGRSVPERLQHDPEKRVPVFGQDHAQTTS
jgi:hypothetical protein